MKTMILRFRDLVTTPGQTITLHRELARDQGSVYWGWWNKTDEQVPSTAFIELNKMAQADGNLEVYLFDSGRELLYRAVCTEISWHATLDVFDSPDKARTPDYYRDTKYHAWFRFSSIHSEPVDEAILNNLSYHRVDDFFKDKVSPFGIFYDKAIHSVKELLQQQRTIWFVRDKVGTDPTHQISLLNSHTLQPVHFTKEYHQNSSNNLLWVSDLHFDETGTFHNFPQTVGEGGVTAQTLGIRLQTALNSMEVTDLAGIIASGDLTWKAHETEYNYAKSFLGDIASWAKVDNYQFLICPGNHDINFSAETVDFNNPPPILAATPATRAAYENFYEKLFYTKPNKFLSMGRKFLMGNAIPVEIASLNSNYLEQYKKHFQGFGYIGDEQLKSVAEDMGWDKQKQEDEVVPFRIAVLHHHITSVTYTDNPVLGGSYSTTLDSEAFQRWVVKHKVNLVLHGHMHQPFFTKISRPYTINSDQWHEYYVVAMGSTGVATHHLGEVGKNTFGVLSFNKNGVIIKVHSVHPTIGQQETEIFELKIPYK